jgi:hypothetical protein
MTREAYSPIESTCYCFGRSLAFALVVFARSLQDEIRCPRQAPADTDCLGRIDLES